MGARLIRTTFFAVIAALAITPLSAAFADWAAEESITLLASIGIPAVPYRGASPVLIVLGLPAAGLLATLLVAAARGSATPPHDE